MATQRRHIAVVTALTLTGALGATGCTHSATDSFTFESAAAPTGTVFIETYGGAVSLEVAEGASKISGVVQVTARGYGEKVDAAAAAREVELVESGTDADLKITASVPPTSGMRHVDVDLNLTVPPGVQVSVLTDNAPIRVVKLPVGDLTTNQGSIELVHTSGNAKLRTDNGFVSVDGHDGDVDVRTTGDSVELFSVLGNVTARTMSGAITARVTPPRGGEIILSTTNGQIDCRVPYDFGAQVAATTTGEGAVLVEGLDWRVTYSGPDAYEGVLYDGAGTVDLRTTNGDVLLHN